MKKRFLLLSAIVASMFCATTAFAQTGAVRGKVTDKKIGEALAGARVTVVQQDASLEDLLGTSGKQVGRVAGKDGGFEIPNLKPGKYLVNASYVGYKIASVSVTVEAGGTVTANLGMVADVKGLDEVVVTGVASRNAKAVAEIAVSSVNAAQLTDKVGYTSAAQLLSGKVAGVTIAPASGTVGGGIRFNVRSGAGLQGGDPVIFIDGVRIASNNNTGIGVGGQQVSALADLNPADIETVDILKGPAAAALYGTAGQNGVVLITTKHGRGLEGQNELVIGYQGVFGFNEPHYKFTEKNLVGWQEANAAFKTGSIAQNGVNLQGSSGIFNYYAAFEDRQEKGVVPQNELSRQSVRLNLDAVTSKNFVVRANMNFTSTSVTRPQNDNNIYGWMGNTQLYSPLTNPSSTVQNRTYRGTYLFTDSAAIAAAENKQATKRFIGSIELSYSFPFLPGLKARALAGYDARATENTTFFPPNYAYGSTPQGQREIFQFNDNNLNFDLQLLYETKFGGWNSNTILATQTTDRIARNFYLLANTFPTELVRDIGAGKSDTRNVTEFFSNVREAGVMFREELNFEQTYFFSGGFRWDFASTYGAQAPNIFYPQASAMVRLDKHGVLPETFNLTKVRVAYGESGRLPGLTDGKEFLWQASSSPYGAGAVLNIAGNPTIQPERVQEVELGLDFELDNAYGAQLTYYLSNANQSLINVPRAPSMGLGAKPSNIAKISQWGLESEFYARPLQTAEYALDLSLIVNYADNKVKDLGYDQGGSYFITDGFSRNYLIPDQRRSEFMGLRPLAPRFTSTGYYSYTAAAVENAATSGIVGQRGASGPIIDTTGVIRTPTGAVVGYAVGSAIPLITGSFSINFKFLRDFTLYALAEYALGGYVYNATRQFHSNPTYANNPQYNELATKLGIFGSGVPATAPNAATDRGPAAQVAVGRVPGVDILTPGTPEYQAAAEQFMRLQHNITSINISNFSEKADWLRIREVSLRYNATGLLNDLGLAVKSLSVALTANNLKLFTTYSGPEVEVNAAPGETGSRTRLSAGQDFLTMMQTCSYNFIINFGF